jgi:hypothetical protein
MPVLTTDCDVVELANRLAAEFYRIACSIDVPPGYRFDLALHPWERACWQQAVVALAMVRGIDAAEACRRLIQELSDHEARTARLRPDPRPSWLDTDRRAGVPDPRAGHPSTWADPVMGGTVSGDAGV